MVVLLVHGPRAGQGRAGQGGWHRNRSLGGHSGDGGACVSGCVIY